MNSCLLSGQVTTTQTLSTYYLPSTFCIFPAFRATVSESYKTKGVSSRFALSAFMEIWFPGIIVITYAQENVSNMNCP